MPYFKSLFILLLVGLYSISYKAYAYDSFIEEFNSNFSNQNTWTVFKDIANDVSFDSNSIFLKNDDYNFPYIYSSNIFPENGNFEASFSFQYLKNGGEFGTGIVLSDNKPLIYPDNTTHSVSNHMLQVWSDGTNGLNYASTIEPSEGSAFIYEGGFYIFYQTKDLIDKLSKHTVNIKYINKKYYYYVDGTIKYVSQSTDRIPNSLWFGNPKQVNQDIGWYDFSIDYIKITQLPTKMLDVPHFSQIDDNWKDVEYDHSSQTEWGTHSIGQWGCALTSANMVLNFNGYEVGPDTMTFTNPLNLNSYLNDNHGYDKNAGLFWNAISKYAKRSKKAIDVYSDLNNLEFEYLPYSREAVVESIDNDTPAIIQIVMDDQGTENKKDDDLHFVVAEGYDDNHIYINDPLVLEDNDDITLEDRYPEKTYRKIARYNPADSDLSYILMHLFTDQQIKVKYNDLDVPNAQYYDEGGFGEMYGSRVFMLPKPDSGEYTLEVAGKGNKQIDFELLTYDMDGNDTFHTVKEKQELDGVNTYILNFDRESEKAPSTLTKLADSQNSDTLFQEIKDLIINNKDKFKNKGQYNLMLTKLNLVEFFYKLNNYKVTNIMLDFMIKTLERPNKNIDEVFRVELLSKISDLKASI